MGKKKTDVIELEEKDLAGALSDSITKQYGDGIIVSGSDFLAKHEEDIVIPFSPAIDTILGGGVPEGTMMTISGRPKQGKSSSSLHFAARCQKKEYGYREVFYHDIEHRLKKMNLIGTPGLDLSRFHQITSIKGKILSAEDHLTLAQQEMKDVPGCVVILDSISAMATVNDMNKDLSGNTRQDGAKLLSQFCKNASPIWRINKCIVIGMVHLISNVSGYGPMFQESGGMKIQYYADIRLRIKSKQDWEMPAKNLIGQMVTWDCECSALGPPGGQCNSYLRYGQGIDETYELLVWGKDLGLVNQAGAWYTADYIKQHLPDIEDSEIKSQGEVKIYQLIKDNPQYREWLEQDIKKIVLGS